MNQVFYTNNGEITIDKNRLWVKRINLDNDNGSYRLSAIVFQLLALVILTWYQVKDPGNTPQAWNYFSTIILAIVILSNHWLYIYKWLFVYHWNNNFFLKKIVSVRQLPEENILEVHVEVTTRSGRVTIFRFRKSEPYAAAFINAVNEQIVMHDTALINKQ